MTAKIPLPADFLADDKEKELSNSDEFRELAEKHQLTIKEQKYALLLLSRPDLTHDQKSARAGFAVDENGKAKGHSIPQRVKGILGEALCDFGITEDDLALSIRGGLFANKVIPKVVPTYNDKGKKNGSEVRLVTIGPDHAIRKYYVELLMKHGNYSPQKMKHEHEFSPEMVESLDKVQKRERLATTELDAEFEEVDASRVN